MNGARGDHEPVSRFQRARGLAVNQQFARAFLDITDLFAGMSMPSRPRSGGDLDVRGRLGFTRTSTSRLVHTL